MSTQRDILSKEKKNETNTLTQDFEKLWEIYPKKQGKPKAFEHYKGWLKGTKKYCGKNTKLSNKQMWYAIDMYAKECEASKKDMQYIQMGSTFFNSTIAEYAERIEE